MNLERDVEFILFKPRGCKYANIIFGEIENELKLKIAATKGMDKPYFLSRERAEENYSMHKGKHFYELLINHMISGPAIASVLTGEDAIDKILKKAGYWDPREAEKDTWRERFGDKEAIHKNAIHRADTSEAVRREIPIHFLKSELIGKLPTIAIQYLFKI